jgi:hypothetical protein
VDDSAITEAEELAAELQPAEAAAPTTKEARR